jgi:hypothetical protein
MMGIKGITRRDFINPEGREKSIRYTMQSGLVDAVVIGVKSAEEIDEAIMRINSALAVTA